MGQLIDTWGHRDEGKTREMVSSDPKLNRHISFLMVALMSWHNLGITWLVLESKSVGLQDCTSFFQQTKQVSGRPHL